MNWFFFGSLMDPQVLEVVVGRYVHEEDCHPAELPGYRRVRVRGESYPALVQTPGESVDGLMVEGLSAEEGLRVIYFEGDEYRPEEIQLQLKNAKPVSAFAFLAGDELPLTEEDWALERWAEQELDDFLPRAEAWMEGYGDDRSVADNDAIWGARGAD